MHVLLRLDKRRTQVAPHIYVYVNPPTLVLQVLCDLFIYLKQHIMIELYQWTCH